MFNRIEEIINFLKKFEFSEHALIEVIRNCYFTKKEKKIFEYYPDYLNGKFKQSELGFKLNYKQSLISETFSKCKKKIKIYSELFKNKSYDYFFTILCKLPDMNRDILCIALAGVEFVKIAKLYKVYPFIVSLSIRESIKIIYSFDKNEAKWVFDILSNKFSIRSAKKDKFLCKFLQK